MFPILLVAALAVTGPPPQAPVLLDTPFVAQTEALCGGAALTMVMRYWGDTRVNAEDFAPLIDPSERGIPTSALLGAAASRGWSATRIAPDQLAESITRTRPVIALLSVGPNTFHYVVVVGVTSEQVVLHDPARSPYRTMTRKEFDAASATANRWMAVVMPSDAMARPADPVTCDALVASAVATAKRGETAQAADMLDAAIFRCPSNPGPWRERAGLAFAAKQYGESARLASRALALDEDDEYTRALVATSLYLADQPESALKTWDNLRVTRVDITGATTTPQSLILSRLNLSAGDRLTASAVTQATHRLSEMPSLSSARVRFTPDTQNQADVTVVVGDRPRVPTGLLPWTAIGVRAVAAREVALSFSSLLNAGDRLDVLWRFQTHREFAGATLSVPAPRGLPGNIELFGRWEQQTFASPAGGVGDHADGHIEERRRRGGVAVSDWATHWLRWRVGAAIDHVDGVRAVSISADPSVRLAGDRVAVGVGREQWFGGTRRGDFHRDAIRVAARTSTDDTARRVVLFGSLTDVSASAPRLVWPAADVNFLHEGTLRAHPLFSSGVLDGATFGRRLAAATMAYEHPVKDVPLAHISAAAFVDIAKAWRGDAGRAPRALVDVGLGLRLSNRSLGAVRLDLAVGARDGKVRLTAGYMPTWPW